MEADFDTDLAFYIQTFRILFLICTLHIHYIQTLNLQYISALEFCVQDLVCWEEEMMCFFKKRGIISIEIIAKTQKINKYEIDLFDN